MKLGTFPDMLFIDSFEESLARVKEMGFEYIDLREGLDGNNVDNISLDKARSLKSKMDEYGLKGRVIVSRSINPISFVGPPKYDKYDKAHHAKTIKFVDHLCDVADAFGAGHIRVNPMYRSVDYHKLSDAGRQEQIDHCISVISGIAEHLKSRGKVGILENEPPSIGNKAEELGQLVRGVNSPNLLVNWDIVNDWRAGVHATVDHYEAVKGILGGAHLKGAYKQFGTENAGNPFGLYRNFAIPDQDDFDHEPLLKAIAKHDPEAIITIDTHYHQLDVEDRTVGSIEVMRRSKVYFESLMKN
jgi:3-dehydroshikimate dehydratase